jgi:hypothetical protein
MQQSTLEAVMTKPMPHDILVDGSKRLSSFKFKKVDPVHIWALIIANTKGALIITKPSKEPS